MHFCRYLYIIDLINALKMEHIKHLCVTFRCDIPVVFYKMNTKYNCQSKHNNIYCTVLYNMLHNYMFRPFSLDHLQVVYTSP